jgi:protein involved in polysaccharide export with SLBB domain
MGNDDDLNIDDYEITGIDMSAFDYSMTNDTITLGSGTSTVTVVGGGNINLPYASSTVSSSWGPDFHSTAAGTVSVPADGDIKIGDRSLKEFMTKMEERLAILVPDTEKLEKFEALKTAYDHYKLMERLCQLQQEEQ